MARQKSAASNAGNELRDKILATAADLFYKQGIRAVGVDLVVEKSGAAKTSLYRHFGTKDDLVVAFLQLMDQEFWKQWDSITNLHPNNPKAELYSQLDWIGERSGQPEYRGCPHINIAAEFPDIEHPARKLAQAHKRELRRRLKVISERLGAAKPDELAGQIAVLINGAFVSTPMFENPKEATVLLHRAVDALIKANTVA